MKQKRICTLCRRNNKSSYVYKGNVFTTVLAVVINNNNLNICSLSYYFHNHPNLCRIWSFLSKPQSRTIDNWYTVKHLQSRTAVVVCHKSSHKVHFILRPNWILYPFELLQLPTNWLRLSLMYQGKYYDAASFDSNPEISL